ncbi:MAG: PLP-dependent aminotransferase family protein [Colwellia sp.]|nr:PLP-dependent aminotransferase family protein [Colwellia sp.]
MVAKYIQLAENVIADIESEQLKLAQRMPSVRKFSSLYNVSITTALNCYQRLEELGWLFAKPQSGFFVTQPLGKIISPQFPSFKSAISAPKTFKQSNVAINSPFYVSQFAPQLLSTKAIASCFRRSHKENQHLANLYPDPQGKKDLRTVLAKHFSEQYFNISAENLVVTNGCIDAIKTAIEVTTQIGDTVAISSPCFIGLIDLLANMGRMTIEIPFHQAQLDLEQLEKHMFDGQIDACLFSANHINPQGNCLSSAQKQALVNLAERYEVPIIEDDVYLELNYTNTTPLPIKHWDKSGWVLWCNSISKTLGPGYRLGWCEPGRYLKKYLEHRAIQTFGINIFVQSAILEFFYSGQYIKHLRKLRLTINQQMLSYYQLLKDKLPKNTRISTPHGGLVMWIQIPDLDSDKLLIKAIKHDIYFRVGSEFSTIGLYRDCFRINFGWPIQHKSLIDNIEEIDGAIRRYQQLLTLCQLVKVQLEDKKSNLKG